MIYVKVEEMLTLVPVKKIKAMEDEINYLRSYVDELECMNDELSSMLEESLDRETRANSFSYDECEPKPSKKKKIDFKGHPCAIEFDWKTGIGIHLNF